MNNISLGTLLLALAFIACGNSGAKDMNTSAPTVFTVGHYGAKGDGVTDDGPAIRKAVSDAVALGKPAMVTLSPKKSYYLAYDPTMPSLQLDNAQDVEIDGKGATLLLEAPESAVSLSKSARCTVRNLTIDYPKLPYTQGMIVGVDPANASFDLALMPGYDLPASQPADTWWVSILGPTGHGLKQSVGDALFLQSVEPVAGKDRTYRLTLKASWVGQLHNISIGDRSFLPTKAGLERFKHGALFSTAGTSDTLFENITIYSSPGMCFLLYYNIGKVTIRGVRIINRPGTDRVMSSRSDGVHCAGNLIGPTIENCVFEGLMDDSINIHCMGRAVTAVVSDMQITAPQAWDFRVGDMIQAYDAQSGKILGNANIVSRNPVHGGISFVLSAPITGMTVDPAAKTAKTVLYDLSQAGSGFVIRNNTFLPQRRYAALIRAHNGLIEGNTVTGGAGYDLSNETGTYDEGPIPDNVIIRNNKFSSSPGIKVETSCSQPTARAVQNIVLDGNTFTNLVRWPLIIRNAHNVTVKNTTIRQGADHPMHSPLIVVLNSDNVSFEAPLAILDEDTTTPGLVEYGGMSDADMSTFELDWSKAQVNASHLRTDQWLLKH